MKKGREKEKKTKTNNQTQQYRQSIFIRYFFRIFFSVVNLFCFKHEKFNEKKNRNETEMFTFPVWSIHLMGLNPLGDLSE